MRTDTEATPSRADWLVPAALIALSIVPAVAGAIRLAELWRGAVITPDNQRFFAAPWPVAVHIACVTGYGLLGAFQFSPGLRRRRPGWHRAAGRVLAPCGLASALSGLWLTWAYPYAPGDGAVLFGIRQVVGTGMVLSILLGLEAIRRRDFARHGAWMVRGYAIGLGAGTQVVTGLAWVLLVGHQGELERALVLGASWVLNLLVAEWLIRRTPLPAIRLPPVPEGTSHG